MARKMQILGSFSTGSGGNGLSAYEVAKKNGFEGSETEWLESLKGETGETGPQGPAGSDGKDGVIALTGATVGQTVKISAVDEAGVPTAWEPVDMPSGEKAWSKIAVGNIVGYLSEVEWTTEDADGFSEFYIQIKDLMTESLTAVDIVLYINDIDTGLRVSTGTHGWGQTGRIYGKKVSDTDWLILKGPFSQGSAYSHTVYGNVAMSKSANADSGKMKKLRFTILSDTEVFKMGCHVWGR